MGTRARVNVFEGNQLLVSIYKQFDGYPDGLGQEVADFLNSKQLVNGIQERNSFIANGMGCLAAQLVKHLKKGVGDVYIRDTGPESQGEEYIYNVSERDGVFYLAVLEGEMTAFGMPGNKEGEMNTLFYGPVTGYQAIRFETAD
jgi:hypothetical protein